MKIAICGSIAFTREMGDIANKLKEMGHEIHLPFSAIKILEGKMDFNEFMREKEERGDEKYRNEAQVDLLKRYFELIKESDAILVLNMDKKGIKNYIGGNTLIEMGFAHVLEKDVFLLNPIPEMDYTDEIKAMKPVVINHKLEELQYTWELRKKENKEVKKKSELKKIIR